MKYEDLQQKAKQMLEEMEANRLEVILIPAPDPQHCGHQVRVACSQNPLWYRRLMEENDYKLTRKRIHVALRKISSGLLDLSIPYHELLWDLIESEIMREEPC